jgi:hypothetical protein
MTNNEFSALLKKSSDLAFEFAKEFVTDELPPNYKYSVALNYSTEKRYLMEYDLYPGDDGRVVNGISGKAVSKLLCRRGKVPVWIDISVAHVYKEYTVFSLLCAGRYSNDEEAFYYTSGGTGPFGIKSPVHPPDYVEGQKFKLKPVVRKSFINWLLRK